MFGFHWPELILLVIVALVIFGPKRLPEIGGALGQSLKEFKKSTSDDQPTAPDPAQIPATPPVAETRTVTQPAEAPKDRSAS